jgi:cellulose synthase/poly-beta-1,6-N-acetylglucosamine synthase-like glycosyltransferase
VEKQCGRFLIGGLQSVLFIWFAIPNWDDYPQLLNNIIYIYIHTYIYIHILFSVYIYYTYIYINVCSGVESSNHCFSSFRHAGRMKPSGWCPVRLPFHHFQTPHGSQNGLGHVRGNWLYLLVNTIVSCRCSP